MQKIEAEIIDLEEARVAKASGGGGGFDHFSGMKEGTVFCCVVNGNTDSLLEEYMLGQKLGLTVLLLNRNTEKFERRLSHKFWTQHTMVQILHIPEDNPPKEEVEDGTSA